MILLCSIMMIMLARGSSRCVVRLRGLTPWRGVSKAFEYNCKVARTPHPVTTPFKEVVTPSLTPVPTPLSCYFSFLYYFSPLEKRFPRHCAVLPGVREPLSVWWRLPETVGGISGSAGAIGTTSYDSHSKSVNVTLEWKWNRFPSQWFQKGRHRWDPNSLQAFHCFLNSYYKTLQWPKVYNRKSRKQSSTHPGERLLPRHLKLAVTIQRTWATTCKA